MSATSTLWRGGLSLRAAGRERYARAALRPPAVPAATSLDPTPALLHPLAAPPTRKRSIDTSMGAFSVQVAMCLLVGVQAALLMPKRPQSHDVLLVSGAAA